MGNKQKNNETELKILEAAKEVFAKNGYAGARMQEIADTAGINKGLLHYYFKTKDKLFEAIFFDMFDEFAPRVNIIFESNTPLFEKIESFVEQYIDTISEKPYLPIFVMNELSQRPEEFVNKIMKRQMRPNPITLLMQIQKEVQQENIRSVNPLSLVINIISMCAFPFVGRPLFQSILQLEEKAYIDLMKARKKEIAQFIIDAIEIKK